MSLDYNRTFKVRIHKGSDEVDIIQFGKLNADDEEASNQPIYSDLYLRIDDTVDFVKKKIFLALKTANIAIPTVAMYITATIPTSITPQYVWGTLSNKNDIHIEKTRVITFLTRYPDVSDDVLALLPERVSFNDLLQLKLDTVVKYEIVPVTIHVNPKDYHSFVANPASISKEGVQVSESIVKSIGTTNNNRIIGYGDTLDSTFDLYTPESMSFVNNTGDQLANIFFPLLFNDEIQTIEQYVSNLQILVKETEKSIGKNFNRRIETVSFLADLKEQTPVSLGVTNMVFDIIPTNPFNLPLDVVFKKLTTTKQVPLVKYNPGKRQEKVYRLYTQQIATNGKKIPLLSKGTIFKLAKTIGKSKQVVAYCEDKDDVITVAFNANSVLTVSLSFSDKQTIDSVERFAYEKIKLITADVIEYLSQSGYSLPSFQNLNSTNIDVISISLSGSMGLATDIDLKKISACVASAFTVTKFKLSQGIVMRYKRVSNYSEVDSMDALIIEMMNQQSTEKELISALVEDFNISESEAQLKLAEALSSFQVMQSLNPGRKVRIRNNPGFPVSITKDRFSPRASISVTGITSLGYVELISMYVGKILSLTQISDPALKKKNETLCRTKKTDTAVEEVEEKLAENEESYMDQPEAVAYGEVDEDEEVDTTVLNMLLDDDDEEEEEEEEDMDQSGGVSDLSDITGLSLSNPNPFFKKMETLDPVLFLTQQKGKFNAYSRACPWNVKRQPVILTDEEKDKIDREHAGSYEHAIKYGSSPDKQYWYICPRYWSLKDNVSLTEEQVKSGKYGKVIPNGAKKVPAGHTIFEFTDNKYHTDEEGKYVQHYPGFIKEGSHPDGYCLPCCFKSWSSPAQEKRRKECSEGKEQKTDAKKQKPAGKLDIDADEYIKGPDKFPLDHNRWGYLPPAVAMFLKHDNSSCQVSATNTNLKEGHTCLLRHGVETSDKKSFLACMADIYAEFNLDGSILSIEELIEHIVDNLSLDEFITLQNGTLVNEFGNDKSITKSVLQKYQKNAIVSQSNLSNPAQKRLIYRAINGLQSFNKYLSDPSSQVDYTYTWDLFSLPREWLFPKGVNLVIINMPEDDVTQNVEVVCPTNHYSGEMFSLQKKAAIIVKRGGYMENVFAVKDTGKSFALSRLMNVKSSSVLPGLKSVLEMIAKNQNSKCRPLPSMPKVYTFKENHPTSKIIEELLSDRFTSIKLRLVEQVVSYRGQSIALIVLYQGNEYYVPTQPSSIQSELAIRYIDAFAPTTTVRQTIEFLELISRTSNNTILCKPKMAISEQGVIVGILTETNQFVPTMPEIIEGEFELPIINETSPIVVDRKIAVNDGEDQERQKMVKRVRLESSFYSAFRNTARILLGRYQNIGARLKIEDTIKDSSDYKKQLAVIAEELENLLDQYIRFIPFSSESIDRIESAHACVGKDSDNCHKSGFCVRGEDKCSLMIPSVNMITGKENKERYYLRLADELLRYTRIRTFMFQPDAYLSLGSIPYDLSKNEVILLQSLLTQEYFDDLEPAEANKYIESKAYENLQPLVSVPYTNEILTDGEEPNLKCEVNKHTQLPKKWKEQFPPASIELIFENEPLACSFNSLVTIARDYLKDTNINVNDIKKRLAVKYEELSKTHSTELIRAFTIGGKKKIASLFKNGKATIADIVLSDTYYLSNIDIVIISQNFRIPLILFSSTTIPENNSPFLSAYTEKSAKHYFLKVPGVQIDGPMKYKLVASEGGGLIKTSSLRGDIATFMKETQTYLDIEQLLTAIGGKALKTKKKLTIK